MPFRFYEPVSFVRMGWRHRRLIRRLARRKIEARYRGSMLGLLWTLVQPLLMLGVYTFVFSVIFRARWGEGQAGGMEFALFLFSGMIIYTVFSECVNEAPHLIYEHQALIKQVVFPSEVLAWVSLLASLAQFVVGLALLLVFNLAVYGGLPATAVWLPLVMLPVLLGTLGLVWIVSSLGVFLRDISQIVGLATTALLFLSPIFYSSANVPESLRPYYAINPFARLLEMSKDCLFYGHPLAWRTLGLLTLGAWALAWLGYAWFMNTKRGFADVV